MRCRALFAIAIVAACGGAPARRADPEPVVPRGRIVLHPAAERPPLRWSNVTTVDNCFYFSGPFDGRDENLRGPGDLFLAGSQAELHLASAVFTGTLDGDAVQLARTTTREFEGTWTVTETVAGTLRDDELRAQYRYEECGHEGGCPGRCTTTADLAGPVTVHRQSQ